MGAVAADAPKDGDVPIDADDVMIDDSIACRFKGGCPSAPPFDTYICYGEKGGLKYKLQHVFL